MITGGTKGISCAIAECLAAEGADVAICARNAAEVDEAIAALSKGGRRVFGRTPRLRTGHERAALRRLRRRWMEGPIAVAGIASMRRRV